MSAEQQPGSGWDEERIARAWLSRAAEPGSIHVARLVERLGAVPAVADLRAGRAPALAQSEVASRAESADGRRELVDAADRSIDFLVPGDPEWPADLDLAMARIQAAGAPADRPPRSPTERTAGPVGLWTAGSGDLGGLLGRSVSIVGSRACTSYGDHVAADLAFSLAERGWTVVSGGAFGIDAAAHRGALAAGAPTIAVLAGGLDAPYPRSNSPIFDQISRRGLLVSEWPLRSASMRHRFLIRNRVIAAMTAGTVVVEAAARSGALATARWVRRAGRHLMAVPGPVTSALSAGTNELIRGDEHAELVAGIEDVLQTVGRIGLDLAPRVRGEIVPRDQLDAASTRVLDAVPVRRAVSVDRIAATAGIPARDVQRIMPMLALHGFVRNVDGGWRLPTPGADRSGAVPSPDVSRR